MVMVVRRGRRAGEGKDGEDAQHSRKELVVVGSSGRASVRAEASVMATSGSPYLSPTAASARSMQWTRPLPGAEGVGWGGTRERCGRRGV